MKSMLMFVALALALAMVAAIAGCGSVTGAGSDAAAEHDATMDAGADVGAMSDGRAGDASAVDATGDAKADLSGYPACDTEPAALTAMICPDSPCDSCIWNGVIRRAPENCVNMIGRLCAPAADPPKSDMFGDCAKCPL